MSDINDQVEINSGDYDSNWDTTQLSDAVMTLEIDLASAENRILSLEAENEKLKKALAKSNQLYSKIIKK